MNMKKILSCITALAMAAGSCGITAFAEDGIELPKCISMYEDGAPSEYGYQRVVFKDQNGNETDGFKNLNPKVVSASVSQSKYNLYDDNRMTSVKDQGQEGLCWAYTGIACAESSMISQKLANTSVDYSEKHLAWFTNGAAPSSTMDPMYGDGKSSMVGTDAYDKGGNIYNISATLGRWSGVQLESTVPQSTTKALSETMRYTSYAHLQNVDMFDTSDLNSIKKAIIDNGGVYCAYYSGTGYTSGNGYTAYYQSSKGPKDVNHAVTIIGWDDNFSKSNFKKGGTPSSDGAWLIKNSWGEDWGTDGLFWMSYEEASLDTISSVKMESVNNYGSIYQYDGNGYQQAWGFSGYTTAANVFTASADETLTAFSFYAPEASLSYTVKVYTGVTGEPTTGTCALTQNGTMTYAGYHTVDLSKEIAVAKGTKFAVCVTFNKLGLYFPCDNNANDKSGVTYLLNGVPSSSSSWYDLSGEYNCNACIKAFTKSDVTEVGTPTLKGTAGIGQVALSWTSVSGATKYRLQRYDAGSGVWSTVANTTGTSYNDTSVKNGTTYKYRVYAYIGTTAGSSSNVVTATPVASVGTATLSGTAGIGKVTLSWTSVTGATAYRLQRYDAGSGVWATLANSTATSYNDTSVKNGTTYKYRVYAYVGSTMGSASNVVTATPVASVGTATLSSTAGIGKVTLSWTSVTGATKYRLQRYDAGSGVWATVANTTGTSYNDTSVTNGTAYKYRVYAYAGSTAGSSSNVVTATPVASVGTATLSSTAGIGKVTLSWTSVSGATKYRLQRYDAGSGVWATIANTTAASYNDTSVTNGTAYKYRVYAYIGTTVGSSSNVVTATPVASVGTATLSGTAGVGKVTLSWTSVTGATKYRLQRYDAGSGVWATVAAPTGTSYEDTSVTNGTTYMYRIYAYVGTTMGSASNVVTVTAS